MSFPVLKKILLMLLIISISLSTFAQEKFDENKMIPEYHSDINSIIPKTFSLLSEYQIKLMHFRINYGTQFIRTDFFSVVEYFGKNKKFDIAESLCHTKDGEAFEYNPDISTSLLLSAGYIF